VLACQPENQETLQCFGYIEINAKKKGRNLSDMKLEEMDALWNEAKKR
jgi:uncharacterized protein YabN with tetrapyrrole methylase and pyrophosphatase domain